MVTHDFPCGSETRLNTVKQLLEENPLVRQMTIMDNGIRVRVNNNKDLLNVIRTVSSIKEE